MFVPSKYIDVLASMAVIDW